MSANIHIRGIQQRILLSYSSFDFSFLHLWESVNEVSLGQGRTSYDLVRQFNAYICSYFCFAGSYTVRHRRYA